MPPPLSPGPWQRLTGPPLRSVDNPNRQYHPFFNFLESPITSLNSPVYLPLPDPSKAAESLLGDAGRELLLTDGLGEAKLSTLPSTQPIPVTCWGTCQKRRALL